MGNGPLGHAEAFRGLVLRELVLLNPLFEEALREGHGRYITLCISRMQEKNTRRGCIALRDVI